MFDLTLTFDNGPEPGVTPRVLDTLRERGIKATFFVIGEKLGDAERRQLAVRAHNEGHWIGNHTFTHSIPLGQQHDTETAEKEIGRTQAAIWQTGSRAGQRAADEITAGAIQPAT